PDYTRYGFIGLFQFLRHSATAFPVEMKAMMIAMVAHYMPFGIISFYKFRTDHCMPAYVKKCSRHMLLLQYIQYRCCFITGAIVKCDSDVFAFFSFIK